MKYTYEICIWDNTIVCEKDEFHPIPTRRGYVTKERGVVEADTLDNAKSAVESKLPSEITDREWMEGYGHTDETDNANLDWLIIQGSPGAIVFLQEPGYQCIGCGAIHGKPQGEAVIVPGWEKGHYVSYGGCLRCGDLLYVSTQLAEDWPNEKEYAGSHHEHARIFQQSSGGAF